ncbi:hypothetical protein Taro_044304 [Colocasia esculenta]|uniref:Aminotransferase-like plant mobile domain-containing protein n=1 Tax=Colocasia esculenta TaxID=4460 RepID=A0A843WLK0_COLES|nr:hypothetical protein [Colocasia esculenta]
MEMEEGAEAPMINAEEERMRRAKAMKSVRERRSDKGGSGRSGLENASARPVATECRDGLGRREHVAVIRADATGEMRTRVSWTLVMAVFLAYPPFQRERVEEMGFGEIFRIERMRADLALTHALRSRWDTEATAFVFPWGHMIPNLEDDLAERLLKLPVGHRSSLVPRVALQESFGLFEAGKNAGETEDEHLERLVRISRRELASEPGVEADLDLRRFLVLFLGRLLFATRDDAVHCHFLPLLEDLSEVGWYAWGAAFLAHQFDSLGASERQTSTSGFFPFLQLERLQEAIDSYPYLDVVWQPYLGESDEGQPWLVQAHPYFDRSMWVHAFNLVLPLRLFLCQRSLGLRQSAVEFPVRDRYRRPGRSFRGLHDPTDWRERAKEQINNWEHKGKAIKSMATTDDAHLEAYALKYGGKVYKSARHQVDVVGEVASLRALLYSAMQDREAAQRQTEELRRELERVRSTGAGGASSSRAAGGSPSLLEAQLAGAVLRAEEAQRHLEERGEIQTLRGDRDQLRIRAEAVEARDAEATRELEALRVQGSSVDQAELTRLRTDLQAQQAVSRSLQEIVTAIGRSHSRSRSGASVSKAMGASVDQYLAGSSSRRRNEEEERRRRGETSAQSGRGGGEMPPPPDRQEGSGESGGGQ